MNELTSGYRRMTLNVDPKVEARLKALFKSNVDIYDAEDDILQLIYDTRFIINKTGTALTLSLKGGK